MSGNLLGLPCRVDLGGCGAAGGQPCAQDCPRMLAAATPDRPGAGVESVELRATWGLTIEVVLVDTAGVELGRATLTHDLVAQLTATSGAPATVRVNVRWQP